MWSKPQVFGWLGVLVIYGRSGQYLMKRSNVRLDAGRGMDVGRGSDEKFMSELLVITLSVKQLAREGLGVDAYVT